MPRFGDEFRSRRDTNERALAAFAAVRAEPEAPLTRSVHEGRGRTIYTVGYERRTGVDLADSLHALQIEVVIDVRQHPMSRKADFRLGALSKTLAAAGVEYESWTDLGSTESQREALTATGDVTAFKRAFRRFIRQSHADAIARLAGLVQTKTAALLCYERDHDACHRSVLAELVHERCGAPVAAIL